jgi:hypothetical protein
MVWQVVAMWAIVIVTITWFVRDERRLRREAVLDRAARYYAHAPKYRYSAPTLDEQPVAPPRRVGGLTQTQRAFLQDMATKGPRPD